MRTAVRLHCHKRRLTVGKKLGDFAALELTMLYFARLGVHDVKLKHVLRVVQTNDGSFAIDSMPGIQN